MCTINLKVMSDTEQSSENTTKTQFLVDKSKQIKFRINSSKKKKLLDKLKHLIQGRKQNYLGSNILSDEN